MIPKAIYTLFLGILLALFVGVGVAAFYPAPKQPEYSVELNYPKEIRTNGEESPETREKRIEYDKQQKAYMQALKTYNTYVSIAAIIAALFVLIISLLTLHKIKFVADGVMLGGVLTLLYAIIRGFMTESSKFQFGVISIGLVVAIGLGYLKFVKQSGQ